MSVLLDTSGLFALADVSDRNHARVLEVAQSLNEPLVLVVPVLPEICYLLASRLGHSAMRRFLAQLANSDTITREQLPHDIRDSCQTITFSTPRTSEELKQRKKELREKSVEEVERRFVTEALRRNNWNVTRAADDVGMLRPNFQALMRRHHASLPKDAPSEED